MRIVRLASTPSTQDVARDLPLGSVVVADFQTEGRGRLRRAWEAPPGTALLASFVILLVVTSQATAPFIYTLF